MGKKADLSINVIIVAVLALIVLLVLVFIFSDKINVFGKGVSTCQGKCVTFYGQPGEEYNFCENQPGQTPQKKYSYNPSSKCPTKGNICCMETNLG